MEFVRKQLSLLIKSYDANLKNYRFRTVNDLIFKLDYNKKFVTYIDLREFNNNDFINDSIKWKEYKVAIVNKLDNNNYDIITLIPVLGRHNLLEKCITSLQNQTIKTKIILIVSNDNDKNYAIYKNLDFVLIKNSPLGNKIQYGVNYIQYYYGKTIKYLMICGSDDIFTCNWIKECLNKLKTHDVVGNDQCYIYEDTNKLTYYYRKYKQKDCRRLIPKNIWDNFMLGSGRIVKREILDDINWSLYPHDNESGLDRMSSIKLASTDSKFGLINNEYFVSIYKNQPVLTPIKKMLTNKLNMVKEVDHLPENVYNLLKSVDLEVDIHNENDNDSHNSENCSNNCDQEYNSEAQNIIYIYGEILNLPKNYITRKIDLDNYKDIINNLQSNNHIMFNGDINYDYRNVIIAFGLKGHLVLCNNCDIPNCLPYHDDERYLTYFLNFYKTLEIYDHVIIDSVNNYKNNKDRTKIITIIASHKRANILDANLSILKKNKSIDNIVISTTLDDEINICKKHDICYCVTRNQPLGEKWYHGVLLAKLLYPKYIIILGSDDFICDDYIENVLEYDFDLYSQNGWINYDIQNDTFYKIKYKQNEGIGAGRIISYRILDNINWQLFPINTSSGLDTLSKRQITNAKGVILLNDNPNKFIISPKYLVDCMNPLDSLLNNKNFSSIILKDYEINYKNIITNGFKDDCNNILFPLKYGNKIRLDKSLIKVSSSYHKLIRKNNNIYFSIKKVVGTPGFIIFTNKININSYYRLTLKLNIQDMSFCLFCGYKYNNEQIRYNRYHFSNIKNIYESTFDTIDCDKVEFICIFTQVPKIIDIIIYNIDIEEIEYTC